MAGISFMRICSSVSLDFAALMGQGVVIRGVMVNGAPQWSTAIVSIQMPLLYLRLPGDPLCNYSITPATLSIHSCKGEGWYSGAHRYVHKSQSNTSPSPSSLTLEFPIGVCM